LPGPVAAEVADFAPRSLSRAFMSRVVPKALLPHPPDEEPASGIRFARWLLFVRSMWLRMPPWLLAYHSVAKLVRSAWRRPRAAEDG
jgi:hypothetical protein